MRHNILIVSLVFMLTVSIIIIILTRKSKLNNTKKTVDNRLLNDNILAVNEVAIKSDITHNSRKVTIEDCKNLCKNNCNFSVYDNNTGLCKFYDLTKFYFKKGTNSGYCLDNSCRNFLDVHTDIQFDKVLPNKTYNECVYEVNKNQIGGIYNYDTLSNTCSIGNVFEKTNGSTLFSINHNSKNVYAKVENSSECSTITRSCNMNYINKGIFFDDNKPFETKLNIHSHTQCCNECTGDCKLYVYDNKNNRCNLVHFSNILGNVVNSNTETGFCIDSDCYNIKNKSIVSTPNKQIRSFMENCKNICGNDKKCTLYQFDTDNKNIEGSGICKLYYYGKVENISGSIVGINTSEYLKNRSTTIDNKTITKSTTSNEILCRNSCDLDNNCSAYDFNGSSFVCNNYTENINGVKLGNDNFGCYKKINNNFVFKDNHNNGEGYIPSREILNSSKCKELLCTKPPGPTGGGLCSPVNCGGNNTFERMGLFDGGIISNSKLIKNKEDDNCLGNNSCGVRT